MTFILRMLLDQRGEVGDVDAPVDEDVLDEEDVVNIDPNELEEEDSEDEPEEKKSEQPDLKAELDKRDAEIAKMQEQHKKEIGKMNYSFTNMRKKLKSMEKPAEKEAKFTDEQLKTMMEENEGDYAAQLNIMRHVAQQEATSEAKNQVSAQEISQRKKDMDKYLLETFPDAMSEGSKDHQDLQNAKNYLHLDKHPLGDSLAAAATMWLQMPDLLENAKKEARETATKVEKNRKKSIKENSVETPAKKKAATATGTKDQMAVAKQLGLSKSATKVYLKLVNKGNSATVEG